MGRRNSLLRRVTERNLSARRSISPEGVRTATAQRDFVNATLARADVAAGLAERGVSVEQARARVAALTDDEVAVVAQTIETAPAGASDILGVLVTIFIILLITDILGLTKVFPFTRPVR